MTKSDEFRTQQTLIERLKDRQDEKAWSDYVTHYQYFILGILVKMGFSHHDAEDMKQDVLLRSWKGMKNFEYDRKKCKFRTWLGLITRNHAKNYFASKAGKLAKLKSPDGHDLLDFTESNEASVEQFIETEWQQHVTKLAWERLQNKFNDKALDVYLALTRGDSAESVAEAHQLSQGSVYVYKQRVHRALCKEICHLDEDLS